MLLVLCNCVPAISAEISVNKMQTQFGEERTIFMQGGVEPADVGNIINAIARNPSFGENENALNKPQILVIFGRGEDYPSAIEISRIVNATRIRTMLCPCATISRMNSHYFWVQMRSSAIEMPWPTPTHMLARPYFALRIFSSSAKVPVILAPLIPKG